MYIKHMIQTISSVVESPRTEKKVSERGKCALLVGPELFVSYNLLTLHVHRAGK